MSRTVPQYGAGPRRNGNPDLGGNLRLQGRTRSIVAVSRRLANRLNMSYANRLIDLLASPVSKSAVLSDIEEKHVKIRGGIEMYKGKPEIRINAASQLEVERLVLPPIRGLMLGFRMKTIVPIP
jgi:hypothetical protein